jgi:hypothetical protein
MSAPWELTVWLVCQGGRPFDYRTSRSAAFNRAAMLRAAAPSGDWSVEERRAQLVLLEPESRADERDGGEEMSSDDVRLKPCEHCQSEGRIIRAVSRHGGLEPKEEDCGECPVCKGTGMEMIEVESIDLDDSCRNGGCQYGMAPEYTCRHECQYKRANSKQETVSDERDGAVAERSAAQPTCCECGRTPVVGLDPPLCIHCYGRDALRKLADAADDVGVKFFDTDTMDPLVEKMQAATEAARRALKGGK